MGVVVVGDRQADRGLGVEADAAGQVVGQEPAIAVVAGQLGAVVAHRGQAQALGDRVDPGP
jgi:hypothetical protein